MPIFKAAAPNKLKIKHAVVCMSVGPDENLGSSKIIETLRQEVHDMHWAQLQRKSEHESILAENKMFK